MTSVVAGVSEAGAGDEARTSADSGFLVVAIAIERPALWTATVDPGFQLPACVGASLSNGGARVVVSFPIAVVGAHKGQFRAGRQRQG